MASPVEKIQPVNNRAELMIERLLSQFRGKVNVEKLLNVFSDEIQLVEDTMIQLITLRTINNATGQQLDNIGAEVGVYRVGQSDDEYRNAIKVRAFRKTSDGTEEDLITMLTLYTGDEDIIINKTKPYNVSVVYSAECLNNTNGAEEMLRFFPVVTVLLLQQRISPKPFGFATTDDPTPTDPIFGNFASSTGLGNDPLTNGSFTSLVSNPNIII